MSLCVVEVRLEADLGCTAYLQWALCARHLSPTEHSNPVEVTDPQLVKTDQDILRHLWNPIDPFPFHKRPSDVSILTHMNLTHILKSYCL
jgi:hypothetical protein